MADRDRTGNHWYWKVRSTIELPPRVTHTIYKTSPFSKGESLKSWKFLLLLPRFHREIQPSIKR